MINNLEEMLKFKLNSFLEKELDPHEFIEWAKKEYYNIISNDQQLYVLANLSIMPFLSDIAFREPDMVFDFNSATNIKCILNGKKYFSYFFYIKLNYHFNSRIHFLEKCWNEYKFEKKFSGYTLQMLEKAKIQMFQSVDLFDIIYNDILELLLGLPMGNNKDNSYNSINIEKCESSLPYANQIQKLFSIYYGKEIVAMMLLYTMQGVHYHLII